MRDTRDKTKPADEASFTLFFPCLSLFRPLRYFRPVRS